MGSSVQLFGWTLSFIGWGSFPRPSIRESLLVKTDPPLSGFGGNIMKFAVDFCVGILATKGRGLNPNTKIHKGTAACEAKKTLTTTVAML